MINRAPHIHSAATGSQQPVIPVGTGHAGSFGRGGGKLAGPWPVDGYLAHEAVCRLIQVVRHLYGKTTAWGEFHHQRRKQCVMPSDPLQDRIGEDHIERPRLIPAFDADELETNLGQPRSCRLEHVGRAVQSRNEGVGKARGQQLGRIAGAAADIHHAPRLDWRYRRQ